MLARRLSVLALASGLFACSSATPVTPSADAGPVVAPGSETLGVECTGACGSADDRKCAVGSEACASNLCIIDPARPADRIAYCTVDCTNIGCPAGWRCEDITSFADRNVTKACVAEPPSCGDGVVQITEVCDGDDPVKGHCADCKRWEPVCGDGVVQEGEACDGDTDEGYCQSCRSILKPSIEFTVSELKASALEKFTTTSSSYYGAGFKGDLKGDLPIAGDERGCGAVKILESTAEYTRLEWTNCSTYDDAVATVTFAIPRTKVSYTSNASVPTALQATIHLKKASIGKEITWQTSDANIFELSSRPPTTAGDHLIYSDLRFSFERPDPSRASTPAYAFLAGWIRFVPPVIK